MSLIAGDTGLIALDVLEKPVVVRFVTQLRSTKGLPISSVLVPDIKEIIGPTTSGASTPETIRLSSKQIDRLRSGQQTPDDIADLAQATRPTPPPIPAPEPRPVPIPRVTRQAFARAQQAALNEPIARRLRAR